MKLIKNIFSENNLMAIIIRRDFNCDGIHFFTESDNNLQVGFMKRPTGYSIQRHNHKKVNRQINSTNEVLFLRKGSVRVDFYNNNLFHSSEFLNEGDIIILISGGHGFFIEEEAEIFEVKQGPYLLDTDKERF